MKLVRNLTLKRILLVILCFVIVFAAWRIFRPVPLTGDWQEHLAVASTAEFHGDKVTIRNVRNFRYYPTENDLHKAYYDKEYDLTQVKRIWYVSEPFNQNKTAAHTFVSFEFNNGDFLAISIEARKTNAQTYGVWRGAFNSYPLIYIASDERDVLMLRANLRKDKVYVYPVKLEKPENARLILVDMLQTMNELVTTKPAWYNSFFANCTSRIADHVNHISPGRISKFSWQLIFTASADELALKNGLLDTDLTIEEARKKFYINDISERVGDVPSYSKEIRNIK